MTFEQCAAGRRVSHASIGAGIIDHVSKDNGEVDVIYDKRDSKGNPFRGKYDRRWFEICGELLSIVPR